MDLNPIKITAKYEHQGWPSIRRPDVKPPDGWSLSLITAQNRQVYLDASPIHQVDQVQKPVRVLHGLDDDVVPPEASEEWIAALRRAGKFFEYKTYPDEPHGFLKRENQLDVYARIERFLDWHLLP